MRELSVVVASKNARRTIWNCLDALVNQDHSNDVEIVVVDASTDDSAEIARQFKQITLVRADPELLVPELWKMGIERTNGQSVAFTTASFIPAGNWIAELRSQLTGEHAAVGGVFEKLAPDRYSQWAIYFLRYAAYLPSTPPHPASQLAADNAVYRRWVFEKYAKYLEDGFWEHPVNLALKADGHSLFLTPALMVSMGYFGKPGDFFLHRFYHGRIFGAERTSRASLIKRLFYIIASPLIPLVLLLRVAANVLRNKSHLLEFVFSMPWILYYVLGWSSGEFAGYLFGKTQTKPVSARSNS